MIILLAPICLYYFGYNYYLIATEKFWKTVDEGVIYVAIKKSKKKTDKKKIIIGDSVGAQLFPVEKTYDSIYSLATTAPSSLIGSYILIKNLLENQDISGRTIFYIAHPTSLSEDLRGNFTFSHFVKPFYCKENFQHISPYADSLLNNIPFLHFSQLPFIITSNFSPEFDHSTSHQKSEISKLYIEYLTKIKQLSEIERFKFRVVAPYLREDQKENNYEAIKEQIDKHKLNKIFEGYFENMTYINIERFETYGNHYKSLKQAPENEDIYFNKKLLKNPI